MFLILRNVRRFKSPDLTTHITKGAPDFCTVVIISKGKVMGMRNAVRSAPTTSPFRAQIQNLTNLKPPLNADNMTPRRSLMTPKSLPPIFLKYFVYYFCSHAYV